MSKKVCNLVVGIVGGLSTIAVAINASIGIGCTAIIEICGQFVKA